MKTSEKKTKISTLRAPLHDGIARLAYELWEKRGRPTGCDLEIWLEAERALVTPRPVRRNRTIPANEGQELYEQTDSLLARFENRSRERSPTSL